MKLNEICSIQTGVYGRTSPTGNAIYLQLRHFDEYGNLDVRLKPDFSVGSAHWNHLLQDGDILFAAKGVRNTAFTYKPSFGSAVASSSFLVLRLKNSGIITPEYLAWYINNPRSQEFLRTKAKGSTPASITVTALGDLSVNIPSLEMQHKILHVHELRVREKHLLADINRLKEEYIQYQLISRT